MLQSRAESMPHTSGTEEGREDDSGAAGGAVMLRAPLPRGDVKGLDQAGRQTQCRGFDELGGGCWRASWLASWQEGKVAASVKKRVLSPRTSLALTQRRLHCDARSYQLRPDRNTLTTIVYCYQLVLDYTCYRYH